MADTPGQRVKAIRKALGAAQGDDTYPISQAALAKLLTAKSGRPYRDDMVTKMERGKRKVSETDARWLAEIDPLKRGAGWILGWPPSIAHSWDTSDLPAVTEQAERDEAERDAEPHPHTKPARRAK